MRHDDNSRDAWEKFRKGNGELTVNGRILQAIDVYGPLSCERIRTAVHGKHQTVSAQISHLRVAGELEILQTIVEDGRRVNVYVRRGGAPQLEIEI